MAGNGGLLALYLGKAPEAAKHGFFVKSQGHWDALRTFILELLPARLPDHGFIGGDRPGEDDFHVAAWMARIAATSGAQMDVDGLKALEKDLGKPVPQKFAAYWEAWSARPSWKEVYADGLH